MKKITGRITALVILFVALVALANSITLTPGTITVDLHDNHFLVHALDAAMVDGLDDGVFVQQLMKMEEKHMKQDAEKAAAQDTAAQEPAAPESVAAETAAQETAAQETAAPETEAQENQVQEESKDEH